MLRLTQRQINHGVFGMMFLFGTLFALIPWFQEGLFSTRVFYIGAVTLFGIVWWAYWRGWETARAVVVLMTTILSIAANVEPYISEEFALMTLVPPSLALILGSQWWVIGSAVAMILGMLIRSGWQGVYTEPVGLMIFALIVIAMLLSRLAIDNVEQAEAARHEAEAERARAEAERVRAEQKTLELEQRNAEQQRLLELVASLETPAIAVADGVLLVPLVGRIDGKRAQTLTSRLLESVHQQQVRQVILDIAGVTTMDGEVAQGLIQTAQALRLLGCRVAITGISAAAATTLTDLNLTLDELKTLRSPQEVLIEHFQHN